MGMFEREGVVGEEKEVCGVGGEVFGEEKVGVRGWRVIERKWVGGGGYRDEEGVDGVK